MDAGASLPAASFCSLHVAKPPDFLRSLDRSFLFNLYAKPA
jgi:hypothetical protein